MTDETPSPGETLQRVGMGAGLAVGMGVGVALGVALDNMAAGIGIGLAIGTAMMVAFTVAGNRMRRTDDARDAAPGETEGDPGD
jgi:hypothetical protein